MSSMTSQQKDQKIQQLKALLGQAKNKITELKSQIDNKTRQIQQIRIIYEKKIQKLQQDQGQIMKQYEQRIIRLQRSLQQSDQLVTKYQSLTQTNHVNYQNIIKQLTNISNLIMKNFNIKTYKQNNEAIEELCNIEKCKDFQQKLQKVLNQVPELGAIVKSISKINSLYEDALKKKRQARLLYLKKQTTFQKQISEEEDKHSSGKKQIQKLKLELKQTEEKYQKKIQIIAKSKAKVSEEKTNLEFIKQLLIKIFLGPKQAATMAFQVLSKVLKFTQNEYSTCIKKLK